MQFGRQREYTADDAITHEIREFATGVGFMEELQQKPTDIGGLVEQLVLALQRQTRAKAHPVVYVSAGLSMTLILAAISLAFNYGSLSERVAALEARTVGIEVVGTKLDSLKEDFQKFEERWDREHQQK